MSGFPIPPSSVPGNPQPDASSRSWELRTKYVLPFSDIEHVFLVSEKEINFLIFAVV